MAQEGTTAPAFNVINTSSAPKAIGPYSQAIVSGNLVFCSGNIPLNPQTMKIERKDIEGQTQQVLDNIKAVLEASGSSLKKVVKTTVYLKDMNDFKQMNAVYEKMFSAPFPARTTVQVTKLPMDARVEIECIAVQ